MALYTNVNYAMLYIECLSGALYHKAGKSNYIKLPTHFLV